MQGQTTTLHRKRTRKKTEGFRTIRPGGDRNEFTTDNRALVGVRSSLHVEREAAAGILSDVEGEAREAAMALFFSL